MRVSLKKALKQIKNGATAINLTYAGVGKKGLFSKRLKKMEQLVVAITADKCQLTSLKLFGNEISDTGAKYLSEALKSGKCQLTSLNLDHNNLTATGAKYLSDALQSGKCQLTSLILQRNNLTDTGAQYLSEALSSGKCQLTRLDLDNNKLTYTGAQYLSEALSSGKCQLTSLDLGYNKLTARGAQYLSKALKSGKCQLTSLNLYYNNLTDTGAQYLSEALKSSNCQLTWFNLGGNRLTDKMLKKIDALLAANKSSFNSLKDGNIKTEVKESKEQVEVIKIKKHRRRAHVTSDESSSSYSDDLSSDASSEEFPIRKKKSRKVLSRATIVLKPKVVSKKIVIEKKIPPPAKKVFDMVQIVKQDKNFQIDFNSIKMGKKLGQGGFGVVYAATWRYQPVAVKQLLVKSLSKEIADEFMRETKTWYTLKSPNIVQLFGICTPPSPYCMVMEHMQQGDLYGLLHSNKPLSWECRITWAIQIGSGLDYLHTRNIIHKDLKSPNILVNSANIAKLADFGLAETKEYIGTQTALNQKSSIAGTQRWMAPELHNPHHPANAKGCTKRTDIFAYGMILWEIASRKIPFPTAKSNVQAVSYMGQGYRDELPGDTPAQLAKTIRLCWQQEPKKRPTIEAALQILTSEDVKEQKEKAEDVNIDSIEQYNNIATKIGSIASKRSNVLMFSSTSKKLSSFNSSNASGSGLSNNSFITSKSSTTRASSRNKTAKAIEKLLNLAYPLDDADEDDLEYRNVILTDIAPYRLKRNPSNEGKQILAGIKANLEDILQEDGVKYDAKFKLLG